MSIWYLDYDKADGEGIKEAITNNYLNGFIQRIDERLRRHSFGVFVVLGKEGCFEVRGVMLFRGEGIPEPMKEHSQFEYWKQKKLDPKNEADRNLFAAYFDSKEGGQLEGMNCVTRKWYK